MTCKNSTKLSACQLRKSQSCLPRLGIQRATAEDAGSLVHIADALGDIGVIADGTALSYGIPLDDVRKEIHRSNMSKLDSNGKPIKRSDGKILKSELYSPPDIAAILKAASKSAE